jgi:two-component system CheB/CheR fusion protein
LIFKEVEVRGAGDRWYQVRCIPYRTTDNVIDGLVITFVNISKIKQLLNAETKFARILSSSPTCVFTNDLDLTYLWAGDPGPLGVSAADIIGKKDEDFLSPDSAALMTTLKRKAIESDASVRELVRLSRDGETYKAYDLYVQPGLGPEGAVTGIACVLSSVLENPNVTP